MTRHQTLAQRFVRDERGVIALTFVVTFSFLLAGSLIVFDIMRYNVAQARVQNALDTAVISAGRKLANYKSTGYGDYDPGQAWRDDATQYFNANLPDGFLGLKLPASGEEGALTITYSEDRVNADGTAVSDGQFLSAQRISMSISGKLPLLSAGYVDQTSMNLGARNWAMRRVRNDLELVLALDNTGSMSSDGKMALLKTSSQSLIDTVMAAAAAGGQGTGGASGAYIGIVPFTDAVNVRGIPTAKGWLDVQPMQQNYIDNTWTGCIVEPGPTSGSWSNANKLPAEHLTPAAKFKPLLSTYSFAYKPDVMNARDSGSDKATFRYLVQDTASGSDGFVFGAPSNLSQDRRIKATIGDNGWNNSSKSKDFNLNIAVESLYCPQASALFLSKNQTALTSAVNAMNPNGGTGIPSGLLWAWRMLSPDWRGATGWGDTDLPRDGDSKLRKVIVLLSDGDNAGNGVVRRQSDSQSDPTNSRSSWKNAVEVAKLTYAYKKCTKTNWFGSKCDEYSDPIQVPAEPVSVSLPYDNKYTYGYSFYQCPINGLLSVDPQQITKGNYDNSCSTSTGTVNSVVTGYGSLSNDATFDDYMAQLCSNIKNDNPPDHPNNITIYTLTLGRSVSSAAKAIMRTCASDPGTYFDVSNADDLPKAFEEIAGALTELRLTNDPNAGT